MTTLCFLWHMHQPFYKDLWTGQYKQPWTRLHALKDYAGMVRILRQFPSVRQTFNLVPSMVAQIEEYADGTASDPYFDCAVAPAEALTGPQRAFVRRNFFHANLQHVIPRYPRYRELYDRRTERFSTQELRDLQVLSQLAWYDEDLLAADAELQEMIGRGRDFTLADQESMTRRQRAELAAVLPVYRDFAEQGQIEISTTPFYHPILPLLCDSNIGAEAHPGLPLPPRFSYPGDARVQLERARDYMREKFGPYVRGLWPSEGSVSDQALTIAAECGFQWAASDNGVLGRTLEQTPSVDVTYRPYRWERDGRSIDMIFRDHYLSDLIGFEYAKMDAESAAEHFLARIRENTGGREMLVPIILDGENAWEWYPQQGRPFLRALYRRIADDPDVEAVTVSEAVAKFEPRTIHHVAAGSWIGANFNIWIGREEDNLSWSLLLDARRAFDEHAACCEPAARALAWEELLICEGSDWNWWYGPEHASEYRADFDQLYRDHLANVYRALSLPVPGALSRTLLMGQEGAAHTLPVNEIEAVLDGDVTSPFEWMGAGHYRPDPRGGSMHGGGPMASDLYYGTSGALLYVRLDGVAPGAEYAIEFERGPAYTLCREGRVVELLATMEGRRFRVVARRNGLPPATLPPDGWIEFVKMLL